MRQSRPRHDKSLRWLLLALALLASQVSLSSAQSEAESEFQIPPVVLALECNRQEYWLGEPVVVVARLYNWFSPQIKVFGAYGLQADSDLRIVHDNVTGERYRAHLTAAPATPKGAVLPYGKALEFRVIVAYEAGRRYDLALYEPGAYSFVMQQRIEYMNTFSGTGREGFVAGAETAGIRVVLPPVNMRAAFNHLVSTPGAIESLNSLMATASTRDVLERIARDYPETRYAPYCLHAIGSYAVDKASVDSAEIERAEWAYKRIIDMYPNYPLLAEVRLHLARLYLLTGRINDGALLAEKTFEASPDNFYRFRKWAAAASFIGDLKNIDLRLEETHWELYETAQLPNALVQLSSEPRSDDDEDSQK